MKNYYYFFFLFIFFGNSHAQETSEKIPFSWKTTLHNNPVTIVLPPIDLQDVREQDSINDLDKSYPYRYGVERDVTISPQDQQSWITLSNGARVWQVAVQSPHAITMSLNFNDFYLPKGAMLHIYNDTKSDILKTFTSSDNRNNKTLGSWFVTGDKVWVEYYEPASVSETVKLSINSIIHGYRLGRIEDFLNSSKNLNESGDCNYDVNCSVGEDFEQHKNILKKSVALLNLGNGFLCTATLVNNTAGDKKPYLLTANHCLTNSTPALWSVRFNWVSPTPVCATEEESGTMTTNFTMSGASVRAHNVQSDFALVELYNPIPASWDIAFSGWDHSDVVPEFGVGIHHPKGDMMKICRDNTGAVKQIANGTLVWLVGGVSVGTGNGWEIGTTESGSSGSPFFDQNGRLIGQLYGGQSACNGTQNNNEYDVYGRFAVSWNAGSTEATRLKEWLDPLNTGQTTIETIQNSLSTPENETAGSLLIYPNPAATFIMVENSSYPTLEYRFYNTLGQQIMSGSMADTFNQLDVSSCTNGVYFLSLTDPESNAAITKKIIISK